MKNLIQLTSDECIQLLNNYYIQPLHSLNKAEVDIEALTTHINTLKKHPLVDRTRAQSIPARVLFRVDHFLCDNLSNTLYNFTGDPENVLS